jgi:hypothetical protein
VIDADAPQVAPCCGSYRIGSDHVIFVGGLLGSTVLTLHDFQTRRIGTLSRAANVESTFCAGPTLWTHEPAEITIVFEPEADGQVRRLTYRGPGAAAVRGERVEIAQEEVRFANGEVTLAGTLSCRRAEGRTRRWC